MKLIRNQWVLFCNPRLSGRPEDVRPGEMGPVFGPFQRVWATYSAVYGQTRGEIFELAGYELDLDVWVLRVERVTPHGGVAVEGLDFPEGTDYSDWQVLAQDPDYPIEEESELWRHIRILDLDLGMPPGASTPG